VPSFAIGDTDFLLDGEPYRILAGALHYFRVHPDQWTDRIRKARLMGLNTIETYIAWNAHSPRRGEFDTSGGLDLARFLDLIHAEGMHAIVRPGPYICAEWDNGGLPAWLFHDETTGIRRSEKHYLDAVDEYFAHLAPILEPRQIDNGGPIILVQIENEYGAYGNDKDYLRNLVELNRSIGLRVPFTTVDQPTDQMLTDGSLPELHKTGSFGARSLERLATLRRHQPTGPLMCSEFWDGWFDHWGAHHHTTTVEQAAHDLDELLGAGASVNIYMFHGGTNFGFTNGANDKGVYQPTVTSYDYDAPLDEAGIPTAKFWAFREVIAKYAAVPEAEPAVAVDAPVFEVELATSVSLLEVAERLGEWTAHDGLPSLDSIEHYSGFALYRAELSLDDAAVLSFGEIRDRAQVFVNGSPIGVLARDHHDTSIGLPAGLRGRVELLVEDQGRVNYGPRLGEQKGLVGGATLAGEPLARWELLPLDLERAASLADYQAVPGTELSGPVFARGTFEVDAAADLFLDTAGWNKGVVWINGFNLGRYWARGPQHTLYVPGPVLRSGENEIVVFEQHALRASARFVARADLGHTEF
jgi:beta-galactosidase